MYMPKVVAEKKYNNFFNWLFAQRKNQNTIGDLARDAFCDVEWDGTMSHLKTRINECALLTHMNTDKALEAFDKARTIYQFQRKKY